MRKFLGTWWGPIVNTAITVVTIVSMVRGVKPDGLDLVIFACNITAWSVIAEVRYRTGLMRGRREERERQPARWN